MKLVKRISLTVLVLFVLSSVGGCFYFKAKFAPAPNYLTLAPQEVAIPFTWNRAGNDPYAGLLLPITLTGCPKTFYLQFDTGAPSTIFYQAKLETIRRKGYAVPLQPMDGTLKLGKMAFQVGALPVTAQQVRVLAHGDSLIDWSTNNATEVIGTLGTDFLEGKIIRLDYARGLLTVSDQLPSTVPATALHDFSFDSRRILLPARINGKETDLLFDSGASTYELLTDKATWKDFAQAGQTQDTARVPSWGKILTAYTTTTNATASFGAVALPLKRVTYIEGMGFMNTTLMRFSGMGGMTGNKLFLGHTLLLDMKRLKFAVLK